MRHFSHILNVCLIIVVLFLCLLSWSLFNTYKAYYDYHIGLRNAVLDLEFQIPSLPQYFLRDIGVDEPLIPEMGGLRKVRPGHENLKPCSRVQLFDGITEPPTYMTHYDEFGNESVSYDVFFDSSYTIHCARRITKALDGVKIITLIYDKNKPGYT